MPATAVSISGFEVAVDSDGDDGFWSLVDRGAWELPTLEAIQALAPEAGLFVDVGSWIGPTVLAAAAAGARVVAYEPDPVARARLSRNLELNPELAARVRVRGVALARRDGTAAISSARLGDSMSSLVRRASSATTVETVRAGRELRAAGVDRGTVIKMDVEGAEFDVIGSLTGLLRRHRPTLIVSWHSYQLVERHRPVRARIANAVLRSKIVGLLVLYRYWYRSTIEDGWQRMGLAERLLFYLRMGEPTILFSARRYPGA